MLERYWTTGRTGTPEIGDLFVGVALAGPLRRVVDENDALVELVYPASLGMALVVGQFPEILWLSEVRQSFPDVDIYDNLVNTAQRVGVPGWFWLGPLQPELPRGGLTALTILLPLQPSMLEMTRANRIGTLVPEAVVALKDALREVVR